VVLAAAAAAAGTAGALRLEPFAGPGLAAFVLFAFPVPVACGLAAGFVSPRKAILWAPVYAAIVTVIAVLLLVGSVESARALPVLARVILGVGAILISGASAIAGEKVAERGWSGKAAVGLTLGCAALVLVSHLVTAHRGRAYERSVLPQILLDIDANYVALPKDTTWQCGRTRSLGCYRICGNVGGHRMVVYAATDAPSVLGIRYRVMGQGAPIRDASSALTYLRGLGFRGKLLGSLSERRGRRGSWCSGLEFTRLTLDTDGTVLLEPFPPFDARLPTARTVTGTRRAGGA
jgi:hypothetical protein